MNAFHVNFIRLGNIAAHATKPLLLPPAKTLAFTDYTTRCNILQFKQRSSLHLRVPNACSWCQGGMHVDPVYGIPEVPFPQRFAAPSHGPHCIPETHHVPKFALSGGAPRKQSHSWHRVSS